MYLCDVHITSFSTNAYQNVSFIGHKAFEKRFTFYHYAIIPLENLAQLYLHWYIRFMCARPPSRPPSFILFGGLGGFSEFRSVSIGGEYTCLHLKFAGCSLLPAPPLPPQQCSCHLGS